MLRTTLSVIFTIALCCAHAVSISQSVDPLTGRAVVNLPLGSIGALDLTVPVAISHHGGSLQVAEGPGNVGMGWNLSLGGRIVREVRGLPDEINSGGKTGWLFNSNGQGVQALGPTTTYAALASYGFNKDTEPDVYYFSAPGLSGKFIFGGDGQIKLIPYQDLDITFSGGIIIKTNTGLVYQFSSVETTTRQSFKFKNTVPVSQFITKYNQYLTPAVFISTWHLTSITSTATGAVANFNYFDSEEAGGSEYTTLIKPNGGGVTTSVDTLYYTTDTFVPKRLSNVTMMNYRIELDWLGIQSPTVFGLKIIESESGEKKEYQFVYKETKGYGSTQYTGRSKRFLIKVIETNSTSCVGFPSYTFSYQGVDTTTNTYGTAYADFDKNWGQDYFGYNNAKFTNRNIPTVYYYANEAGARKLRVTPIPGLTASQVLNGTTSGTNNMAVDTYQNSFGALNQIFYPTGAITYISYEPNKYFDATTNEELLGPGVRVSSITTSGNETAFGGSRFADKAQFHGITKNYQYLNSAGTSTSGLLLYPPSYAFYNGIDIYRTQGNLAPIVGQYYTRVKESVPGQGYRIYEYSVPNTYPDISPYVPETYMAVDPNLPSSGWPVGLYLFPFGPLQDLDHLRGFPSKVSEYTEGGIITNERTNGYIFPQAGGVVQALKFEPVTGSNGNQLYVYNFYLIPVNQSKIVSQEVTKAFSEETPSEFSTVTTTYTYNSKNMLAQSAQTNDDGSVLTQNIKYALDYNITAPDAADAQAVAINLLNASKRYAEVIESYQSFTPRGGTSVTTGARLNIFKNWNNGVWPYQTKSFPQGLAFTPATVVGTSSQTFQPNTNYILENTVEYANGLPINQSGIDLVPKSMHYYSGTGAPSATFINCNAEHAVYEGFELATTRGLSTTSGVALYGTGRTGKKGYQLSNLNPLGTAVAVTKGTGNKYRVSLWAYGTQTGVVTVQAKNGSTIQSSVPLNYSTPNTWAYLEGLIDMSAVSASFNFAVVTANLSTAAILIDDFVALPQQARVSLTTYQPFAGATSASDDRGNSSVINYDLMGRKSTTLDRQRNLVEVQEYGLQRQVTNATLTAGIGMILSSGFDSNVVGKYVQGQQIQFVASQTCLPQVTYDWKFTLNGVVTTATGQTVYKTFSSFGEGKVELTVSSPGYASATSSDTFCVYPGTMTLSMTVNNNNPVYLCDASGTGERVFTTVISGPSMVGWNLSYAWSITDNQGNWVGASLFGSNVIYDDINSPHMITVKNLGYSYQVKCILQASRVYGVSQGYNCINDKTFDPVTRGITFINNSPCQ